MEVPYYKEASYKQATIMEACMHLVLSEVPFIWTTIVRSGGATS
jgi:hypothetical protein